MGSKIELKTKPLSVNTAWKGRRYRSDQYEDFRKELFYMLPRPEEMYITQLKVTLYWGLKTHKVSDVDNPIKPFLDVLSEVGYYDDDKLIYELRVVKVPAKEPWIRAVIEPIEYESWLEKMKKEIKSLFLS